MAESHSPHLNPIRPSSSSIADCFRGSSSNANPSLAYTLAFDNPPSYHDLHTLDSNPTRPFDAKRLPEILQLPWPSGKVRLSDYFAYSLSRGKDEQILYESALANGAQTVNCTRDNQVSQPSGGMRTPLLGGSIRILKRTLGVTEILPVIRWQSQLWTRFSIINTLSLT